MDYLRKIEEDLRNIGLEANVKRKYPDVIEASEQAVDALKSIRELYVKSIRDSNDRSSERTGLKVLQNSDLLAPYLLVCNYADGSPKLVTMALNGLNLLLTHDLVPPADFQNVMRVLSIQATSASPEVQLKLLQVVLQLANCLPEEGRGEGEVAAHLTEGIFCGFLTLALQLCEARCSLSVSSTALGTARQIIGQVMGGACALFPAYRQEGGAGAGAGTGAGAGAGAEVEADYSAVGVSVEQAGSQYALTAIMLVRELGLFAQGMPGEWIRGVSMPAASALDLLTEVLVSYRFLFQRVPPFKKLVSDSVFPCLRPLLKGLQQEYASSAARQGVQQAAAFTGRVVRLARAFLLHYVYAGGLRWEEASSMLIQSSAGAFLSRLATPGPVAKGARPGTPYSTGGFYTLLDVGVGGGGVGCPQRLPSYPALCCLEALAAFLLSDLGPLLVLGPDSKAGKGQGADTGQGTPSSPSPSSAGLRLFEGLLNRVLQGACSLLQAALAVEGNLRDLEAALTSRGPLARLLQGLMNGGAGEEGGSAALLKALHEGVQGGAVGAHTPADLLLLALYLMQIAPRLLLTVALQLTVTQGQQVLRRSNSSTSSSSQRRVFLSSQVIKLVAPGGAYYCMPPPTPGSASASASASSAVSPPARRRSSGTGAGGAAGVTAEDLQRSAVRDCVGRICDSCYETCLDACSLLLDRAADPTAVKAALGVISDLVIVAGVVDLPKQCEIITSILCKYT
ncbi:hypothetical protein B484DRAFT_395320, partial [Ochromonadaceae sp. CCMP2298]